MKHRGIQIVVVVVLLVLTAGAAGWWYGPTQEIIYRPTQDSTARTSLDGINQERTARTSQEGRLAPAVGEERAQATLADLRVGLAGANPQSNRFADAAAKNALLRNDLTWTFGGKQQRGWYLYDSLLTKTLNTSSDATTADFAAAVAAWQKRRRLTADGVLDEKSLMAIVSHWQSDRLKTRTPADPSELMIAPPEDFYDPGRAADLRQVERNTYAAYKEMIAAAMSDRSLNLKSSDRFLKIISSYRSREHQDRLRQQSPDSGRAGLAVNSPHFTGRALDIYVGGSPVDTADANRAIQVNTRAYQWLVRNAERFGFRPYFYEPWHWEYVR
ncbi:MAG TPA: D-alanyl-D-alanine carboxypeptidase family protein [Pyrinomonadaceae bacterium]|nr:D-alanyl-D-alanine carboxypeptidase family protein [Pyrinomonadaceae bacterium]